MATSENSGNLENRAADNVEKYKTPEAGWSPENARKLLRYAIARFGSGKYASARILAGLASKIYGDLGDGWNAHIANGWYESAQRKLQIPHQ